ncbi:MAG: DMT family transporter [Candidatus Aenigmarchaeota archaeon]|nr:DMT family transporter [Candidatus Aenigmarchaeota archaeon]
MVAETGILLGILAMIGFGLNNALVQNVVKKAGQLNVMVYQSLISAALLVPAFLLYPAGFILSIEHIIMAMGIALLGVAPLFTFYKALEVGKIGVIVPVANSAGVFTAIFSVLLLGEALAGLQLLAIAAIILGVILVSLKPGDLKNGHAGVHYALITSVLWGAYFFLLKYPASGMGPMFTAIVTQAGVGLFAALIAIKQGKLKRINGKAATGLFTVSLLAAVGVGAYNAGIVAADVSIVGPLAFAAPVISVLYARFFLKEELDMHQYLALFLIVAGIIALSL